MSVTTFFASPSLTVISHGLIATLLYDLSQETLDPVEASEIEALFYASITEGAQNIIRSDNTKKRMLQALQHDRVAPLIEDFRKRGRTIAEDYFVDQLSQVISERNSQKIAPRFLESFRSGLAENPVLCRQVVLHYLEDIHAVEWKIENEAKNEFEEVLQQVKAYRDRESGVNGGPDPDSQTGTEELREVPAPSGETVAEKQPGENGDIAAPGEPLGAEETPAETESRDSAEETRQESEDAGEDWETEAPEAAATEISAALTEEGEELEIPEEYRASSDEAEEEKNANAEDPFDGEEDSRDLPDSGEAIPLAGPGDPPAEVGEAEATIPQAEEEMRRATGFSKEKTGSSVSVAEAPGSPSESREFENIYVKNFLSGQMVHWDPQAFVLPVRGLRKLESALSSDALLCITGNPGCGKSVLISAYIHNLVFNHIIEKKDVFYYRFVHNVSNYEACVASLAKFLDRERGTPNLRDLVGELATAMAQSGKYFILDDLHNMPDPRLWEMIQLFWTNIINSEGYSGKLILLDRQKPQLGTFPEVMHYAYKGLSVAESNALLRDRWQLRLPRPIARELAKKMRGNPQLMRLFKNWWEAESHTDTELERFAEQLPTGSSSPERDLILRDYLAEQLYDTYQRIDSRLNSFLKAASLFATAEEEHFFQQVYNKIGGGDFQNQLENFVENYRLLEYDDHLDRYFLHDLLRDYYYSKRQRKQIRRILHGIAGQQYQNRYQRNRNIMDAIEGARHLIKAEREEEAVTLLEPVMEVTEIDPYYTNQILDLLKNLNLDLLETDQGKTNVLYNRGRFYLQIKQYQLAEADFLMCQEMEADDSLQGSILYSLALIDQAKGKSEQSFRLLQSALEAYERTENRRGIAQTYSQLGDLYLVSEKYKFAFEMFEKALEVYEDIADLNGALHALNSLGWISKERKYWDEAFDFYRRALSVSEELGDQGSIAGALSSLGRIYEIREEWQKAIDTYHQEMQINEQISDWVGRARAGERIGSIHVKQLDYETAMEFYTRSREIYEKYDDLAGMASVYNRIGTVNFQRQDWPTAMEYYQKSQEIYEQIEDLDRYGDNFARIAAVYRAMEEWERALDMYDKALEIKERRGDSPGIADIYQKIGDIYQDQGEQGYAIEVYERSISMRERLNDILGIAELYFKIAEIHKSENRWQDATELYQKALDIFSNINHTAGMAKTHEALGDVFHALQDWENAVEYYQRALGFYEEHRDVKGMAVVNYHMGNVYHDVGDWKKALEHYQLSLPLFEEFGDLNSIAQVMGNTSSIEFEQKDHTLAIGKQVEILLYFQENNQQELVERVLANLVACHEELGSDTFQALLTNCLDKIADVGVQWGQHRVIPADKAEEMVAKIFYNS